MEDLPSILGDAGMAGAFICFLAWQSKQQAKRLDDMVDRLLADVVVRLDHILEKLDQ